jgi:hypothetical protein
MNKSKRSKKSGPDIASTLDQVTSLPGGHIVGDEPKPALDTEFCVINVRITAKLLQTTEANVRSFLRRKHDPAVHANLK